MREDRPRMVVGRPAARVVIVDIAALEPGAGRRVSAGDFVALDPVGGGAESAGEVVGPIGAAADRVDEGVAGRSPCRSCPRSGCRTCCERS